MTINEIINAINEAHEKYGYYEFGVRTSNETVAIGEECEESHDWDYENDDYSDKTLGGTCSTGLGWLDFDGGAEDTEKLSKAIKYNTNNYIGNTTYIIGGKRATAGADENEAIIENAQVIYVIK